MEGLNGNDKVNIEIQNRMENEKKDLGVYHFASKSSHIVNFNSTLNLELSDHRSSDYIHLSPMSGNERFTCGCFLKLPSWLDFRMEINRTMEVTHRQGRMVLRLASGVDKWTLEIKQPIYSGDIPGQDYIEIGECSWTGEPGDQRRER